MTCYVTLPINYVTQRLLAVLSGCGVGEMGLLNLWNIPFHQTMREIIEISFDFVSALRKLRTKQ